MSKKLIFLFLVTSLLFLSGCMTGAEIIGVSFYDTHMAKKENAAGKAKEKEEGYNYTERVKIAQAFLGNKVTGVFSGGDRTGIRLWQENNGFPQNGKLDAFILQAKINTPAVTNSAPKQPQKKVARDSELLKIQKSLTDKGYSPGAIDGIFGNKTKSALMLFQKDNGLLESGRVDSSTKQLLLN